MVICKIVHALVGIKHLLVQSDLIGQVLESKVSVSFDSVSSLIEDLTTHRTFQPSLKYRTSENQPTPRLKSQYYSECPHWYKSSAIEATNVGSGKQTFDRNCPAFFAGIFKPKYEYLE
jgi:hypothetical protein